MTDQGPLHKGDDRARVLAEIFAIAARDFGEISLLLQQIYSGNKTTGNKSFTLGTPVLGKRKRQKKKKSQYWTHQELDNFENALKAHIRQGGDSENVSVEELCRKVTTRNKKDIEKQVDIYKRATQSKTFDDLPFMQEAEPSSPKAKKKKKSTTWQ